MTALFRGERNGWIYSDIPDAKTKFNNLGKQMLFLHKESGEAYTFTLSSVLVMEKNAARVIARWLRFGDSEFCAPPALNESFNDVLTAFLTYARLHGWDPTREFSLEEFVP